ncbi:minor tail protein [Gordonia phage Puppers]|nr:minor tail protein [Gordonia phage Puppers]
MARGRNVRYVSPGGHVWHLHGEDMGAEGVYLTSLAGFYHQARVPVTLTPAYMRGAIPGPPKTDASSIGMKIFTSAETPEEWEEVESRWWNAETGWSDEADGTLIVESLSTGTTRWQPVRLSKYPEDPFDFEPEDTMDWNMSVISYDPGWRGPLLKSSWTGGPGVGTIKLANPGDLETWPHFAGDPVPGIRLPDGIDGTQVALPNTMDPDNGEFLVVTDQLEVTIEDMANSQVVALLAGLMFQNPIPPGTGVVQAPIQAGGATTIRATIQPLYRRPWG